MANAREIYTRAYRYERERRDLQQELEYQEREGYEHRHAGYRAVVWRLQALESDLYLTRVLHDDGDKIIRAARASRDAYEEWNTYRFYMPSNSIGVEQKDSWNPSLETGAVRYVEALGRWYHYAPVGRRRWIPGEEKVYS